MKKNKGFTLIELLAIIVILAIIAVITVPIILNVIDNAKKGSIKDSAYGYKDAINKYYVSELYENLDLKLDGTYTITDKGRLSNETGVHEIPFTGATPTGGYLKYENNILIDGCITIDEYKTIVSNGEITTVEKGSCEMPKIIKIVEQEEEGKIQTGDELSIGTEHFYVVSSDENETVLLSKYNLLVGNVYNVSSKTITRTYTEEDEGYGLQSETAKGAVNNVNERIGVVAFSSTYYWNGNVGEGLTYPGSYSDPDYPNVYDSNSNLYNYIELYKTKLEKLGASIQEARLLTYQEAKYLGCDFSSYSCPTGTEKNSFITETSFWPGSALNAWNMFRVASHGVFDGGISYSTNIINGVRPVIVVNTSDI